MTLHNVEIGSILAGRGEYRPEFPPLFGPGAIPLVIRSRQGAPRDGEARDIFAEFREMGGAGRELTWEEALDGITTSLPVYGEYRFSVPLAALILFSRLDP